MIALLPCGLRNAFKAEFHKKFPQYADEDEEPEVVIEGNLNYEKSFYGKIDEMTDTTKLPDIFISSDINSVHHQHFINALLNKDCFESIDISANKMYADAAYMHPEGLMTMLPPNMLIIVADKRKFAEGEFPTKWADLMRPELKQQLVLRGDDDFFCNAVFFPFVRDYGYDSIVQLAKNTKIGMHPAEMVKMINADKTDGISAFVMPYSFYLKVRKLDHFQLVWPEEGAIVSPVQMLVKKGAYEKHKEIIDFITGEEIASAMISSGFPSTNENVENKITPHKLNWLGWDFIYSQDIAGIKDKTQEVFFEHFIMKKDLSKYVYMREK